MSRYGDQVNQYARETSARMEHEFGVKIDHRASHGDAGDAVRGMEGHEASHPWEYEPTPTGVNKRDHGQVDLRGADRGRDQSISLSHIGVGDRSVELASKRRQPPPPAGKRR